MNQRLTLGTLFIAMGAAFASLAIAATAPPLGQETAPPATRAPTLVSPGTSAAEVLILDRCPTFSWAAGPASGEQELLVYRTQPAQGGLVEESPIVRVALPAGASVWTPSAAECLESGASYAWTLRPLSVSAGAVHEAEVRLFRVAAAPALSDVRQALDVLHRFARSQTASEAAGAPRPQPSSAAAPQASPSSALPLATLVERGDPGLASLPVVDSAPSPTLGAASLALDEQVHLGPASDVFRDGDLFLWTDSSNLALGGRALESNTTGVFGTAFGESALLSNTSGGGNSAFGWSVLTGNTEGHSNSGFGFRALFSNETGIHNSAFGAGAMRFVTTGEYNTALGSNALYLNQEGLRNTAVGREALYSTTVTDGTAVGDRALRVNTSGLRNTAVGARALFSSTTGSNNVAVGWLAGYSPVGGSDNIFIGSGVTGTATDDKTIRIGVQGTQLRTRIAGISGISLSGGANVVVESDGRLGIGASSRRFKTDVQPMSDVSDQLSGLRPVRFRYLEEHSSSDASRLEYGLIAEEVAEVLPELVARDADGRPLAVRYDLLSTLLLQELRRVSQRNDEIDLTQARLLGLQRRDIEDLREQLERMAARRGR